MPLPGFDSIASALTDLAAGKFLVVLDDENRENEGDLIIAADRVSTEAMAFMVEHTSGVICIGMEGKDLDRLRLPLMINSAENEVGIHQYDTWNYRMQITFLQYRYSAGIHHNTLTRCKTAWSIGHTYGTGIVSRKFNFIRPAFHRRLCTLLSL